MIGYGIILICGCVCTPLLIYNMKKIYPEFIKILNNKTTSTSPNDVNDAIFIIINVFQSIGLIISIICIIIGLFGTILIGF